MVGLKVSNDCKKTEPSKTNNLDDNLENDVKNEEPKPLFLSLYAFRVKSSDKPHIIWCFKGEIYVNLTSQR